MSGDAAWELLKEWLPRQRWFGGSPAEPHLRTLADLTHPTTDGEPGVRVRTLVIVDDAPLRPLVYQVPIVERAAPILVDPAAIIGVTGDGLTVIDGPHDPAYQSILLDRVDRRALDPAAPLDGSVLSGEQSNTSVIFRPPAGHPLICKVFRQLSAGLNPDIELQSALSAAGSQHVPAVVGAIHGRWRAPDDDAHTAEGSLAFAQEFFPSVEDAWRVALRAAAADEDFSARAAALGRTTAEVHLDLARLFPTPRADEQARHALTDTWRRRLSIAVAEVPALRAHEERIARRYDEAAQGALPTLQRIHGDYHLGQVLDVPGRGWIVLDFEGEPMRPMSERREPDLALRDIAGMLRSFDYVAGSLAQSAATDARDHSAWASAARTAFLTGYSAAGGGDPSGRLLDALELEKAVYEAIYEARHRPDWLAIPLAAIERLLAR